MRGKSLKSVEKVEVKGFKEKMARGLQMTFANELVHRTILTGFPHVMATESNVHNALRGWSGVSNEECLAG